MSNFVTAIDSIILNKEKLISVSVEIDEVVFVFDNHSVDRVTIDPKDRKKIFDNLVKALIKEQDNGHTKND